LKLMTDSVICSNVLFGSISHELQIQQGAYTERLMYGRYKQ